MRRFALALALAAMSLSSVGRASVIGGPTVSTFQGPSGGPGGFATVDLDGDGNSDIDVQAFSGSFRGAPASAGVAAAPGSTVLFTPFPLDVGTRVDGTQTFSRSFVGTPSNLPGDYGFRFTSGGAIHYGWASLSFGAGGGGDFPPGNAGAGFGPWAYESQPNTAITVGAVPEPATLAFLLATPAVFRHRRSK